MANTADGDFADMPSLSSYRSSDEKNAAGPSRADCDNSLPSLSSFRLDDLSLASSFHSRGSAATNQQSNLSEESAEGWGSLTSGNFSKSDTDSDDGVSGENDNENTFHIRSSILSLEEELSRLSGSSNAGFTHPPSTTEAKSILRNRGETPSASGSASSKHSSEDRVGILKRQERQSSNSLEEQGRDEGDMPQPTVQPVIPGRQTISHNTSEAHDSSSLPLKPVRRAPSPTRVAMERNDSLPLADIKRAANINKEHTASGSGSCSTTRHSTDGSSSSLRGGDFLPRIPKRTSTMADEDVNEDESANRNIRCIQHDEVIGDHESSNSTDGELSLTLSPDGNDSDDCSVQTLEEDTLSVVNKRSSRLGEMARSASTNQISDVERSTTDPERAAVILSLAPVASTRNSPSDDDDDETADDKVVQSASINGTSQWGVRSIDRIEVAKTESNPDRIFGTKNVNGEESGTDPTHDDKEETGRIKQEEQDEGKRGNLLRRMSSTLKNAGRSASLRNLVRTASKLRQKSSKDQTKEAKATAKTQLPPRSGKI